MDDRAFDNLARRLGGARSRRQVLRRLGTGLAGALAGAVGVQREARAQCGPGDECCADDDCPQMACQIANCGDNFTCEYSNVLDATVDPACGPGHDCRGGQCVCRDSECFLAGGCCDSATKTCKTDNTDQVCGRFGQPCVACTPVDCQSCVDGTCARCGGDPDKTCLPGTGGQPGQCCNTNRACGSKCLTAGQCCFDRDCGRAQRCTTDNQCVCDSGACSNLEGCCAADETCRTAQTEEACGKGGGPCAVCGEFEVCQNNGETIDCVCQREENPCGTRQCGVVRDRCGNSHLCGADGNTRDCPAGQTCDADDTCHCTKDSCGAINGCCAPDETCKTANSNNFCGRSGDPCDECTGSDTCNNSGVCACEPEANPCGTRECGEVNDRCGNPVACGPNNGDCASGRVCCGGACVDLTADKQHCGVCDATPCTATQVCAACKGDCTGQDVARCCPTAKRTNCGGKCTNLKTDEANCGRCGRRCRGAKVCRQGDCV